MTTTAPPRPRSVVRGPRDVVLLLAGVLVLVLVSVPVYGGRVTGAEAAVFRVVDAVPLPIAAVWPVMQLGNFLVVPVAALVAAAFRRWRLAAELLLAGAGVYVLAKVVKGIVVRGRPDALLDDVVVRGAPALGRGFVSGHAAVVTALLVVAWPWLPRPGRVVCAVLAVLVCLARVQVAAHLPLDVVGGAALGLAVAGAVRLLLGRPAPAVVE
ncbi:phosphatase PAP2 family protein [Petropleomorpha daqingensis]|uniref:Undecaprenyl-diphosphatase n=1 Tax=Petropleomorpha daqingensis TaxID=2026353 RepID=A0A853CEI7_9ACTN|nr:undecaprenyl-diphosphatase [Petropleomorpha daqingensis]